MHQNILPPEAHGPLVFGHRGSPREAPENTLPSMALAAQAGAALETDLRGSRDGDVFLLHDPTLGRTTDGDGEIRERTTRELRELDAGYRFRAADGTFPYRGRGLELPLLADLLRAHPGALVNLDIHQAKPSIVPAVADQLRGTESLREAHGGRVILTSRHRSTMREIEASGAPCALGLCRADVLEFLARVVLRRLLERVGLPGRWALSERLRGRALQLPLGAEGEVADLLPATLRPLVPWLGAVVGCLLGPGPRGAGALAVVTDAVVAAAREAGMPVHVWEVDDIRVAEACFAMGVAGVFSNRPRAVAAALPPHQRARWEGR